MHSTFIFSFITIMFLGCSSQIPFLIKRYDVNTLSSSSVGSAMFQWGNGNRSTQSDVNSEQIIYIFRNIEDLKNANGTLHELIYKGILDSIASFAYREYVITPDFRYISGYFIDTGTGAYMKASYNFDVQYDLRKSHIIAFQNFELQLINCDQQGISFEITNEPEIMHKLPKFNNQTY